MLRIWLNHTIYYSTIYFIGYEGEQMEFNSNIQLSDLKLFRCTIISEDKSYFIGKDVFNNKFYIRKNQANKNYKIGTNDSFYAKVEKEGLIIKRSVLTPISFKEYERIRKEQGKCFQIKDVDIMNKIKNI
jgi:hypothetical protein